MRKSDKQIGMGAKITRRDLLHSLGAIAASNLIPGKALADEVLAMETTSDAAYPPALTGMRGNHPGSFEVAHQLARFGNQDWGKASMSDDTEYDLIVVGAGLSGLSAAYLFLKLNPSARILIVDNHDDFGGHAKRNEFQLGGRTVLGYGGSQTMENPSGYPDVVKAFLQELDVDLKQFDSAFDEDFFRRHDLSAGTYFDKEVWGQNKLVRYDLGALDFLMPLTPSNLTHGEAVKQFPISDRAKAQMLGLLTETRDRISHIPLARKEDYLYTLTYKEFLTRHMGITEPEVFKVLQDLSTDACVGIESATAGVAILYVGLPGVAATGISDDDSDPYIHHFPDGNASIARKMVKRMIPAVAKGVAEKNLLLSRFDYSQLDNEGSKVRLRLNSTVVNVEHDGKPKWAKSVNVSYLQGGKTHVVKGKRCVMACYNSMIPSICPELGKRQRKALAKQVKSPILYTNVALRNWQAWKKLGVGAVACPGSYHVNAMMDFPVNMDGYQYSAGPDEPVIIHMERFPHKPNQGLNRREQHRAGRHELLSTSFETIERNVRSQLSGMLGGGGFDPERDIQAITVNRWAHGYSYSYDWPNEATYDDWNDRRYPHVQARQPFGKIAIANADSGATATMDTAIVEAFRAVHELV